MSLTPFDFNGRRVRVIVDEYGEPWLIAMEVAEILGYSDAYEMTKRLDNDEKANRQIAGLGSPVGGRGVTTINEPGLYTAVIGSSKPEAKAFKRWVTHDVLPQIRKTGGYQRPMTQAELIAASANQLVAIERQQAVHQQALQRVEHRVEQVENLRFLTSRPTGFESISHIRERINKRHGLPPWVVDLVMRELSRSPMPFAMVQSERAEEGAKPYPIWPTAAVTRLFDQFVTECQRVTAERATHPEIADRFKIHPELAV